MQGPGDQVHYETTDPVSCPEASKVGSVVATSPLLARRDPATDEVIGAEPVGGDVYIIKPHPGDLSPAGDQDGTVPAADPGRLAQVRRQRQAPGRRDRRSGHGPVDGTV